MDDSHLKLILDRFNSIEDQVRDGNTGIHRRLDVLADQVAEVSTANLELGTRVLLIETAKKSESKSFNLKNVTVVGLLTSLLEGGKWLFGWLK